MTISSEPFLTTSTNAPLAAELHLATDRPSRVSVTVNDGQGTWQRDFYDYGTNHSVPLLGFQAARTNIVSVTVRDRFGDEVTAPHPLVFITQPLPDDFPHLILLKSEPKKMEPGYTLFRVQNVNAHTAYVVAVDSSGQVVWYSGIRTVADVRQLPNGDLFIPLTTNFVEVSMLGQTVHSWTVPDDLSINVHDGVPTSRGTILYLNDASEVVTNFPTSATDPNAPLQTTSLLYNRVVEISATNGALLHVWSLLDMLDPTRITYLTFTIHTPMGWDCEHANAVLDDPRDNSIIVSMREQNAVIKFSRMTGQLKWILGPHANWGPAWQKYLLTPVGTPFGWSYGQHGPMITPQGTLLLYDDGNYRASPFAPYVLDVDNYSRAVEYKIDEKNMEVSQAWDYGPTNADRLFTDRVGNTDWLPHTGNVLATYGYVIYADGARPSPVSPSATMVRIKEVTHDPAPEVVFDLELFDPDNLSSSYRGYWVYRSHRIPDLYPVVTSAREVADLIALAGRCVPPWNKVLTARLGNAFAAIGRHDLSAATDSLHTFQILARVARLKPETAAQLIDQAQGIIDALNAGQTSYATERLTGRFPIFSPTYADADLMTEVGDTALPGAPGLIGRLSAALAAIGLNDPDTAIRDLGQFQMMVRQARLNPDQADRFNFEAQRIIDAIRPASGSKPGRLRLYTKDGKPHLEFSGDVNRAYAVEASTDLVHWEQIGMATPAGGGKFEFVGPHPASFHSRYYRVVTH